MNFHDRIFKNLNEKCKDSNKTLKKAELEIPYKWYIAFEWYST